MTTKNCIDVINRYIFEHMQWNPKIQNSLFWYLGVYRISSVNITLTALATLFVNVQIMLKILLIFQKALSSIWSNKRRLFASFKISNQELFSFFYVKKYIEKLIFAINLSKSDLFGNMLSNLVYRLLYPFCRQWRK